MLQKQLRRMVLPKLPGSGGCTQEQADHMDLRTRQHTQPCHHLG